RRGPKFPGNYQLQALCLDGTTVIATYTPLPLTVTRAFTTSATSVQVGGQLDVQSVSDCPQSAAPGVQFNLLDAGGTDIDFKAFDPILTVAPDGSWSGTITLSRGPSSPGDYQLQALCLDGTTDIANYTPLPLTVTSPD